MSQNFEANDMGYGNFSSVREEYDESKGKLCDNMNGGSESVLKKFKLTYVSVSQEIDEENHRTILKNKKSEQKVNSMLINGFNSLTQINPPKCNEKDLLGKKRECPKLKKDDIKSFYYATNLENNISKKSKVSSNIKVNPRDKTSSQTFNSEDEEIEKNKYNKDNYIKASLKSPYPFLIQLIEKHGGIKLAKVNLKNVFGGTTQNKESLMGKLYQIICFGENNKKILENAKPENEKIYNYFLSREYKFLLKKYYDNDKNFNIDGKDVKIEDFKTFEEVKKDSKIKYYSDENINKFRSAVSIVLKNFEGYEERKPKKEVKYHTKFEYIEKFENTERNGDNEFFSDYLTSNDNEESIKHMPENCNINDAQQNCMNINYFYSHDSNENNHLNNGDICNKSELLNISWELSKIIYGDEFPIKNDSLNFSKFS